MRLVESKARYAISSFGIVKHMQLVLILFGVSVICELLSEFIASGLLRRIFGGIAIITLSFSSTGIALEYSNLVSALFFIVSFYRGINIVRVAAGRVSVQNLRRVAPITSYWLIASQILLAVILHIAASHTLNGSGWWLLFAYVQLCFAAVLLLLTIFHMRGTESDWNVKKIDDTKLPTVTVAIPARNEDSQLEQCLESILASDYPKLEVIVLDDCSQDRTSEIIRKFAHDGVRFISGENPRKNWLAKNQAYEQLFKESSGSIILFCGVDVRFEHQTLRLLVSTFVQKHKFMVSVLPINTQNGFSMAQSFRYIWELVPPRTLIRRPPVLSTCWLINRDALRSLGGFKGVSNMITPEAYFARQIQSQGSYLFVRSGKRLGLTSGKQFSDQFDTSLRVRYPQTHRRPEYVALTSLVELLLLAMPFSFAFVGLFSFANAIAFEFVTIVTCVLYIAMYSTICFSQFKGNRWKFVLSFPVAVLFDVALLNYSMIKYEFSEVVWKGRNVCMPVMQVTPKLPKID